MVAAFGADSPGLARLHKLGAQRGRETGRATPDEQDLDWAVAKAKPGEVSAWATPEGFAALTSGMAAGATGGAERTGQGTMAKAKKKGLLGRAAAAIGIGRGKGGGGKKSTRGRGRRTAPASPGIVSTPIGAPAARASRRGGGKAPPKKGFVRRTVGRVVGGVRRAFGGKGGSSPVGTRKTVPVSLPTANGMALIEAKLNPTTGVYETAMPAGGHHAIVPRAKGGGGMVASKYGGMQMLTMGGAVIGGGVFGMWLQTQPPVTIPVVGWKVRRGVLAFLASLGVAVATRKRWPKVARHAAAFAGGIGAGIGAERVRGGEGLTA
jgi:hypothetical protein